MIGMYSDSFDSIRKIPPTSTFLCRRENFLSFEILGPKQAATAGRVDWQRLKSWKIEKETERNILNLTLGFRGKIEMPGVIIWHQPKQLSLRGFPQNYNHLHGFIPPKWVNNLMIPEWSLFFQKKRHNNLWKTSWLVVSTHLKNMFVKMGIFPK